MAEAKQEAEKPAYGHVTVAEFRDGTVYLDGYVNNEEQRQNVRQVVAKIEGVSKVEDTLTVVPAPFRQVIEVLEPFQPHDEQLASSIKILPHKGCDQLYYSNERLVVDVAVPQPSQHVYADYYTADKEIVAHLFPNPLQTDNFLEKTTSLNLGGSSSPVQWQIQPPLGLELLTVISSSRPLFNSQRLAPESAPTYLEELRKALSPRDKRSSEVVAAYCFIISKAHQDKKLQQEEQVRIEQEQSTAEALAEKSNQASSKNSEAPPQKSPTTKAGLQADEKSSLPSVTFLDTSGFDSKLSSALKRDPANIMVDFSAPITVNNIPERLNKWLATVEQSGGTVILLEDPDQAAPKSRFIASLGLTLAIGAYELIRNRMLYSPAKEYNATVYYVKTQGTITKVVFAHR